MFLVVLIILPRMKPLLRVSRPTVLVELISQFLLFGMNSNLVFVFITRVLSIKNRRWWDTFLNTVSPIR